MRIGFRGARVSGTYPAEVHGEGFHRLKNIVFPLYHGYHVMSADVKKSVVSKQ
jgi:hypothetical protein